MPESEPKPRPVESVPPGQGQGWKAVLKSGREVVVHEIPIPAAEAAAAIPRIQRLADHRHPALSPILAWGTDPTGIWVAVEPNEGTPLGTILTRGPLTPPAATALGTAVLSGVAALHEAGIAMGGFGASAVRVTSNGEVRIAGHPAAAVRGAPAQSDLRADVRSCGMAVCAAFGVDPAGAPAPPNVPPGLVVTMRSMASGAMGPAADRASGALREMAAALLAPDRMVAAQSELALRAGGRETAGVTPFLPKEAAVPPQPSPASPVQPAPSPFLAPAPRDDTPARAPVSYDPPPRAMQTYPSMPAPTFATQPPATQPPAPEASPSSVPTWSEVPARNATSYDEPAPPAATFPPAAQPDAPPVQPDAPDAPPAPPATEPAVTWAPASAAAPTAPSATSPPVPSAFSTSPPAAPASPPAPAPQAWVPIESPAWTPGPAGGVADLAPAAAPVAAPVAAVAAVAATPEPVPTPARTPSVARRQAERPSRPSWMVPAIIAVVLILLLGVTGAIVVLGRGKTGAIASHSPGTKTSPKATASASPSAVQGPLPVPTTYGPGQAAPITSVAFLTDAADTSCTINGPCKVTVELKFSAAQHSSVAYTLKFFDRCTGTTTDLPGNSYTPPGFIRLDLTSVVSLPTNVKSAALVAVSTTPAVAASAPLLLGADSCA